MALGALILGIAVVALDHYLSVKWIEHVPWLYANEPIGARSLLSTIAGSMITVAGVTFSITIAALATTASTFGPRLISNFMQDRGNQITLGTFIATFLFCVLVLRTVRTGDDALTSFVPHAAIIVALLFALASLGVLIYFIHDVPESIHISNIIARLGRDLHVQVEEMFPDALGEPASMAEDSADADPGPSEGHVAAARAGSDGYVQYIDATGLMKHAKQHDLLIELRHRPGDFVSAGDVLAWVRPRAHADQEALDDVQGTIVIGGYQSPQQDILYVVNRLVEVAARALSPGMNDIFTATNAMDWLSTALAALAGRAIPEDARRDDEGRLRIIARSRTFEDIAEAIFDQLRPYVAADRNAAVHLMRTLAATAGKTASLERRAVLLLHAKALRHAALEALGHPRDVEAIEAAYGDAVAALSAPRAGASAVVEPELVGPQ
jgi:uncharacterized membrane protein